MSNKKIGIRERKAIAANLGKSVADVTKMLKRGASPDALRERAHAAFVQKNIEAQKVQETNDGR